MSARAPAVAEPQGGPLSAAEFARRLEPLLPPANPPGLAVACSGGPDSLALTLLAAAWASERGQPFAALVVDHRLRPDSGQEAVRVAGWLAAQGIACRVLARSGPKPRANIAAAAREARYRLLLQGCRDAGVATLLLGHHLEDQAETLLLRLGRGSGADGLSAMAPASRRDGVLLLRPLLEIPKARLRATLEAAGQCWIEDPSNQDPAFARSRMRKLLPALAAEGLTPTRLAATAKRMTRVRQALEQATAAVVAGAAAFDPSGFCRLDPAPLLAAPEEIGLRALARLLAAVSGRDQPPRLERLERLHRAIAVKALGRGVTLSGVRVLPWRGGLLLCREFAAVAEPMALRPGQAALWDGRFQVSLPADADALGGPLQVRALGPAGWRRLSGGGPAAAGQRLPGAVRATLPALCGLDDVLAVPHLGYVSTAAAGVFRADFRPRGHAFAANLPPPPFPAGTDTLC